MAGIYCDGRSFSVARCCYWFHQLEPDTFSCSGLLFSGLISRWNLNTRVRSSLLIPLLCILESLEDSGGDIKLQSCCIARLKYGRESRNHRLSHWLYGHFQEYSPRNSFSNLKQHYSTALGLGALLSSPT